MQKKKAPLMQLLKPHALTVGKKVKICITECIQLKAF